MGFLDQPSDLARTPLAAVLLELFNERAGGVLEVGHGGGTSRIFFRDGQPVGVQVATGFRPLGLILLQGGKIDVDALSRSLAQLATARRPQGQLLVEMGAVTQGDVDEALAEQQAGYIQAIAALEAGPFSFDPAKPIPEWTRGSRLAPLQAIVDALVRPQAAELVISALAPAAGGGVRLASGYAQVEVGFHWTDAERELASRLAVPHTLEQFLGGHEAVGPERARAILAALLLLGLAVPTTESPTPTGDTGAGLTLVGVAAAAELRKAIAARNPQARPTPVATAAPAAGPATPLKRSDPAEARARRQRLLAQAMQNMGIGPFNRPTDGPTATPPPGAAPLGEPHAPKPVPAASASAVARAETQALRKALLAMAPLAKERSFFTRLGLAETATRDEVKSAFLALARQFHPDLFTTPAMEDLQPTVRDFFTAVNEAYHALSDDKRRAEHLATLHSGAVDPQRAEAARIDFQKGEACFRTRDYVRARTWLETAIRADPRPEYQALLALTFLVDPASRDVPKARKLIGPALAKPGNDRAHYVAGLISREEKNEAEAEKQFRAALAANPRHADALRELRFIEARRPKGRR